MLGEEEELPEIMGISKGTILTQEVYILMTQAL